MNEVPVRDQLAAAWLIGQRSPNTRAAYRRDLLDYFAWCDRFGIDVLGARRVHLDGYARWLESDEHDGRYKSKRKYAPSTIARKLVSVSSYYGYAAKEAPALVPANPLADVKRPEVTDESTTIGLSEDEAAALLDVAELAGPLEYALAQLMVTTGLRVSEVCGIDTGDIDQERGLPFVRVVRKGGRRARVRLADEVLAALRSYLRGREGPVFVVEGRRITRQQVNRRLLKAARAAGLERLHAHMLRHTAATLALTDPENKTTFRDVQVMLGHRDPRTTMRYDRAARDLERSAVNGVNRRLARRRAADGELSGRLDNRASVRDS